MCNEKSRISCRNEFEGDITIIDQDKYWISQAEVNSKKDLREPYLQIHHKTKQGFRTVSPNGKFSMVINSPDYYNALKDYDIQISKGYFFKKEDIFSKFVNNLYALRLEYPKGDTLNYTCKLIMNSLYGRFGMRPILTNQEFVNRDKFKELTEKYEIKDFIDLDSSG